MARNQISCKSKGHKHMILIVGFMKKFTMLSISSWQSALKLGREDPRRLVHALKVGVALTLVSFLYLLEPLFKGVGDNAIWAVITVVVVLEFTAGATLCKGLNRGVGTLCAGSLAFLIEFMAEKTGTIFRAAFIGISVCLIGFLATYLRFIPYIKKNYDYGVVIFLLTFNLITVSSFRKRNVLYLARDRLYTIAIGCGLCLLMSLLILPNWSGEDLHHSTVYKIEGLARSIEACVNEYFQDEDKDNKIMEENSFKDPIFKGYRAVLDSKSIDETLATFASWEPRRHSRHCYRYPWRQYVKLGAVLRHFGYTAVALHGCLESEIQTPRSVRALFRDPCIRVAGEVSKVLAELASSIRNRRRCSSDVLSEHLHKALQDLNSVIKSQPRLFLGSNNAPSNTNMLVDWRHDKHALSEVVLPSVKTDISSILERRSKRVADKSAESAERKVLRPTLSKLAITSLEFSDALPFAAFASLLVEMVARLELVIEEVEELGRAANFKEFSGQDGIAMEVSCEDKCNESNRDRQIHVVSQSAE
ncbi:aluminum-activated malate transporter 12-like [Phoenix dactylifera]|uniref:Aluminum-activated malate transporter 12-like n=1 Tax=Phoenix dactylifera TaxID=42345 RepID=A0A8B7BVT2_PHODC|nr:aluminum-activated malate transporter 12-like [Phoenix dactylifera]